MTPPPHGTGRPSSSPATPDRPVPADWLTLRRPADADAREGTQRLLVRLGRHLRATHDLDGHTPVHLLDVGAGTGANQEWLAPRLPFPHRWTLLDHDADLLHHPVATGHGRRVHGGLDTLVSLVEESRAGGAPTVVVASALLDLLTHADLDALAALLVATSTPALFSLTVDGQVTLVPHDRDDEVVTTAFEAHQQREGIAGSTASPHLATRLRDAGFEVIDAATPWRLTKAHPELLTRYLTDRAAVAIEQDPGLNERARTWLARRLDQLTSGSPAVVVGHTDLLVLPPATR